MHSWLIIPVSNALSVTNHSSRAMILLSVLSAALPITGNAISRRANVNLTIFMQREKPGSRQLLPSTLTPAQKSRIRNAPIAAN